MTNEGACLGRADVMVVGAGPCGLSALFEARRQRMSAIGVEAGDCAAHGISQYLEGLPVISPPEHYEVGGLPLDCRDASWLTREELLHYYARVVNVGGLDIRYGLSCVALRKRPDGMVVVSVASASSTHRKAGHFLAKNVIVTAWYRKKAIDRLIRRPTPGVVVYEEGIRNPIQVAGKRTAIIGGGLSGVEQASAIMLCGQSVTMVTRRSIERPARFFELARLSSSTLIEGAKGIRLDGGRLSYSHRGRRTSVAVDAVVVTIGAELMTGTVKMLERAGTLTRVEATGLFRADRAQQSARSKKGVMPDRELGDKQIFPRYHPDLWTHLFEGVGNVRLAGGVLHWGTSGAAVSISIQTARFAVEAIKGRVAIPRSKTRLVEALWKELQARPEGPAALLMSDIESLRPLAIDNWTRHAISMRVRESRAGRKSKVKDHDRLAQDGYFLTCRQDQRDTFVSILGLANGARTVAEIAVLAGCAREPKRALFLEVLRVLWQSNALTWLAPKQRDLGALTPRP